MLYLDSHFVNLGKAKTSDDRFDLAIDGRVEDFVDPWITGGVVVRRSGIHGRGLFALRSIERGEPVIILNGYLFSVADVRHGIARYDSVTGYCEGFYVGSPNARPKTLDEYLNHSCDPCLWLVDELTIVARRHIQAGEELTFDYATWEIDEDWSLGPICNCGAAACRRMITGRDWRLPELQALYGSHFLPCLHERIGSASANRFGKTPVIWLAQLTRAALRVAVAILQLALSASNGMDAREVTHRQQLRGRTNALGIPAE